MIRSLHKTLILLLLTALLLVGGEVQAAAPKAGLFGSRETPHKDLKPFPKWTGVLDKYFAAQKKEADCKKGAFQKCSWADWGKMLTQAEKQDPMTQLTTVNQFMNKHKYVVDPINWGVKDYWAVPDEFRKKFGDCEDYSIAKYMSLRALGWNPKDMRVVVLKDMNLKAMHAVLAVRYKNKDYILDNQISIVVDHKRIKHYRPIFSVSEESWWRHKMPKKSGAKKKMTRIQELLAKKKKAAAK